MGANKPHGAHHSGDALAEAPTDMAAAKHAAAAATAKPCDRAAGLASAAAAAADGGDAEVSHSSGYAEFAAATGIDADSDGSSGRGSGRGSRAGSFVASRWAARPAPADDAVRFLALAVVQPACAWKLRHAMLPRELAYIAGVGTYALVALLWLCLAPASYRRRRTPIAALFYLAMQLSQAAFDLSRWLSLPELVEGVVGLGGHAAALFFLMALLCASLKASLLVRGWVGRQGGLALSWGGAWQALGAFTAWHQRAAAHHQPKVAAFPRTRSL